MHTGSSRQIQVNTWHQGAGALWSYDGEHLSDVIFDCILIFLLVLQALPFLMENLIEPELAKIEELMEKDANVRAQFPNGVRDPCQQYCSILEQFVSWYFMARRLRHTESSILQVAKEGEKLQIQLKTLFPERAGATVVWMHIFVYLVFIIIFLQFQVQAWAGLFQNFMPYDTFLGCS